MTTPAVPTLTRPRGARVIALYIVPLLLMAAAWTVIRYVDQPYRSPTYRRTLPQCVGYAAWVTPTEGAGPLIPLALVALHALPDPEMSRWAGPLIGGSVYLLFAAVLSRVGRRWSPAAHILLGFGWLLLGAVVFTRLTMK